MRLATLYRILKYGGDNSYKNLIRKWKMAIQVKPAVAFVREKARYQVQDPKLLCEALDTTSLLGKRTHAKLATLGDAVLRVALLDDWYPRASTAGPFSVIFAHNGTNRALARIGREIGLVKYIVVQHGPATDGLVATTMEALIAVIYLDSKKNVGIVKASMAAMGLSGLKPNSE